ncbi:MAG: hypothetical protein R2911_29480 [Caldilineaceae bacterium]
MFSLVFALTRGGPDNATELVSIYITTRASSFELGYGLARRLW